MRSRRDREEGEDATALALLRSAAVYEDNTPCRRSATRLMQLPHIHTHQNGDISRGCDCTIHFYRNSNLSRGRDCTSLMRGVATLVLGERFEKRSYSVPIIS